MQTLPANIAVVLNLLDAKLLLLLLLRRQLAFALELFHLAVVFQVRQPLLPCVNFAYLCSANLARQGLGSGASQVTLILFGSIVEKTPFAQSVSSSPCRVKSGLPHVGVPVSIHCLEFCLCVWIRIRRLWKGHRGKLLMQCYTRIWVYMLVMLPLYSSKITHVKLVALHVVLFYVIQCFWR